MQTTLRCAFVLLCFIINQTSFATDYTFTGNGSWTNLANWKEGLYPGVDIKSEDIVNITGQAVMGICPTYPMPSCEDVYGINQGTINIAVGGSLTLQNQNQFSNSGSIIVNGTLINQTTYQGISTGTLTINGTVVNQGGGYSFSKIFGNQGIITVNGGGILRNELGLFDNDISFARGTIVLKSGGRLENISPAVFRIGKVTNEGGTFFNSATLTGNATILGNLQNSGMLSPGNSPGIYTINGDYTATTSAQHNFEVNGTTTGTYDVLTATGTVNLSGAMTITLGSGVTISGSTEIPLITGAINGTFSPTILPDGLVLDYRSNSVVLKVAKALPVRFVTLVATKQSGRVQVSWKVAHEKGVLHYEVEKSTDGRIFSKTGTVLATLKDAYNYVDYGVNPISYYRVRSIDADGKDSYSQIVFLKGETNKIVLKAFIPASRNELVVQHPTAVNGSKIYIHSINGQLLKITLPQNGTQQSKIDLPFTQSHIYVISFGREKEVWETTKVFKLY